MFDVRRLKGYLHPVTGSPFVSAHATITVPMVIACYADTKCVYGVRIDGDTLRLLDTGIAVPYDGYRKQGLAVVASLLGNKVSSVSTYNVLVQPTNDQLGQLFADLLHAPWPNEVCAKPVPRVARQYVPDYLSLWKTP